MSRIQWKRFVVSTKYNRANSHTHTCSPLAQRHGKNGENSLQFHHLWSELFSQDMTFYAIVNFCSDSLYFLRIRMAIAIAIANANTHSRTTKIDGFFLLAKFIYGFRCSMRQWNNFACICIDCIFRKGSAAELNPNSRQKSTFYFFWFACLLAEQQFIPATHLIGNCYRNKLFSSDMRRIFS